MWSRKYVGLAIICRLETGENMSAQKNFFGGAAPEPPRGGPAPLHPPRGGLAAPPLTPRAPGVGAQTLLLVQRI